MSSIIPSSNELKLLQDNLSRLQRPSSSKKRISNGVMEDSRAPHPALRQGLETSQDALETSESGNNTY